MGEDYRLEQRIIESSKYFSRMASSIHFCPKMGGVRLVSFTSYGDTNGCGLDKMGKPLKRETQVLETLHHFLYQIYFFVDDLQLRPSL
jgi:hypothetical protein